MREWPKLHAAKPLAPLAAATVARAAGAAKQGRVRRQRRCQTGQSDSVVLLVRGLLVRETLRRRRRSAAARFAIDACCPEPRERCVQTRPYLRSPAGGCQYKTAQSALRCLPRLAIPGGGLRGVCPKGRVSGCASRSGSRLWPLMARLRHRPATAFGRARRCRASVRSSRRGTATGVAISRRDR